MQDDITSSYEELVVQEVGELLKRLIAQHRKEVGSLKTENGQLLIRIDDLKEEIVLSTGLLPSDTPASNKFSGRSPTEQQRRPGAPVANGFGVSNSSWRGPLDAAHEMNGTWRSTTSNVSHKKAPEHAVKSVTFGRIKSDATVALDEPDMKETVTMEFNGDKIEDDVLVMASCSEQSSLYYVAGRGDNERIIQTDSSTTTSTGMASEAMAIRRSLPHGGKHTHVFEVHADFGQLEGNRFRARYSDIDSHHIALPQTFMTHQPSEFREFHERNQTTQLGAKEVRSRSIVQGLMIQPSSLKHVIWELIGLALILYDVIVIPLDLVFGADGVSDAWLTVMGWLARIFWLVDIFKSLFTGHLLAQGIVEFRFHKVARRYLRSCFPLDALCVMVDWITMTNFGEESLSFVSGTLRAILRSIRILRVGKLIRLFKAPEIGKFVAEHVRGDKWILVVSILSNLVLLLCLAHFIACAWYWIGQGMPSHNHSSSWVKKNIPHEETASLTEKYTWALHWSLAQFTGELIYMPENSTERGFAVFVLLLTFCASVVFAAGITTSMTRLMMVAGRHTSQLSTLRRYLFDHNISTSLSVRMQRNGQHHLLEQHRNVPESNVELLKVISEPLKVELHYELFAPTLLHHPFFQHFNMMNTAGVGMVCHNGVTTTHLAPGDVVFNDCETAVETEARMFFLMTGRLCYKQRVEYNFMHEGDWACEAVLWTHWMHCGTLCADKHVSTMLGIHAQKFRSVLSTSPFPAAADYAAAFVKELNRGNLDLITDLQPMSIVDACVSEAFPENMRTDTEESKSIDHLIRGSIHPAKLAAGLRRFGRTASSRDKDKDKEKAKMGMSMQSIQVQPKPGQEEVQLPSRGPSSASCASGDTDAQTTEVICQATYPESPRPNA